METLRTYKLLFFCCLLSAASYHKPCALGRSLWGSPKPGPLGPDSLLLLSAIISVRILPILLVPLFSFELLHEFTQP
jgi:hypothetical protein